MADMMTFPDTVEEFMEQYKIVDTEQVYTNGTELVPIFRMRQWFEHLPPAQPESEDFEWCTDCKEYDQAQHCCHRWTKVIRQTVAEIKAEQPQPKTGKWIEVHGFCTPGGDPVWACSECGKGVHVYGIEHGSYGSDVSDGQWKACPNCGAKMVKEGETHD